MWPMSTTRLAKILSRIGMPLWGVPLKRNEPLRGAVWEAGAESNIHKSLQFWRWILYLWRTLQLCPQHLSRPISSKISCRTAPHGRNKPWSAQSSARSVHHTWHGSAQYIYLTVVRYCQTEAFWQWGCWFHGPVASLRCLSRQRRVLPMDHLDIHAWEQPGIARHNL